EGASLDVDVGVGRRSVGRPPDPDDLPVLHDDCTGGDDAELAGLTGGVGGDDLAGAGHEGAHGATMPIAAERSGPTAPIRCSPPETTCSPPMTTSLTSCI